MSGEIVEESEYNKVSTSEIELSGVESFSHRLDNVSGVSKHVARVVSSTSMLGEEEITDHRNRDDDNEETLQSLIGGDEVAAKKRTTRTVLPSVGKYLLLGLPRYLKKRCLKTRQSSYQHVLSFLTFLFLQWRCFVYRFLVLSGDHHCRLPYGSNRVKCPPNFSGYYYVSWAVQSSSSFMIQDSRLFSCVQNSLLHVSLGAVDSYIQPH